MAADWERVWDLLELADEKEGEGRGVPAGLGGGRVFAMVMVTVSGSPAKNAAWEGATVTQSAEMALSSIVVGGGETRHGGSVAHQLGKNVSNKCAGASKPIQYPRLASNTAAKMAHISPVNSLFIWLVRTR